MTKAGDTFNRLSRDEIFLLEWLSKEDRSQYGECKGVALTRFIDDGIVAPCGLEAMTVANAGGLSDFDWVCLTDFGWEVVKAGRRKS